MFEIHVIFIPEDSVVLQTSASINPPAPLKSLSPNNSTARVAGASFDLYLQYSAKSNENVFGLRSSNYAHLILTSYCPVSKHRFVSSPMLGNRSGMESVPILEVNSASSF